MSGIGAEQLTERQAQALERLRKAEELEVTVAEYCRSFELDAKELYAAKQALVKIRPAGGQARILRGGQAVGLRRGAGDPVTPSAR